jgi:hypothetical protein
MDLVVQSSPEQRAQLFEAAGARHEPRMDAAIVEKDFWVCWTLRRLFEVLRFRPQLVFKGGTSLSKVYNAIERFSEDVDLSLSRRDLGFADDGDPEQPGISKREAKRRLEELVRECQRVIRDRLLPELRADFAGILGDGAWTVVLDAADPQTVLFSYPKSKMEYGLGTYIRPAIRLELGARSDDWPTVEGQITPYAAESFPQAFMAARSCRVHALEAARTFWEKATLLHAESHRPADKPARERLSRHYYDLHRLASQPIASRALDQLGLLERVIAHKSFFFASSWAHYETARPNAFRLLPSEERQEELGSDYAEMRRMIFGEVPTWDAIVQGLTDLERRINALGSGAKGRGQTRTT